MALSQDADEAASQPGDRAEAPARDVWCPTPLDALELDELPSGAHFVRDHFPPPDTDPASWSLELVGATRSLVVDLEWLQSRPQRTLRVVLECAGHRRNEFVPSPPGVPWGLGAVAEACWTGTRLAPLLESVGIPAEAREVVLEGADAGAVEGFEGRHRFARSLPLAKALDEDVLLVHQMDGKPIPLRRGGPVRALVPGWYATDSVKWLDRIWFTAHEFDGVFQAYDYRLLAPGEPGLGARMTSVPVHALVTMPIEDDGDVRAGNLEVRGVAWGGTGGVAQVLVGLDGGPWKGAELSADRGTYARVDWKLRCDVAPGTHEVACRAIDGSGDAQPERPPANVRGYGNNAVHRVRFKAR